MRRGRRGHDLRRATDQRNMEKCSDGESASYTRDGEKSLLCRTSYFTGFNNQFREGDSEV